MNRTYILIFLSSFSLQISLSAFDDEFFKDIDASFHRMNKRISSSFFNKDEFNKTMESMEKNITAMRKQFEKVQEDIIQQYESQQTVSNQPSYTINDEKEVVKITINVGDVDTNTIDNHVEQNSLIITMPSEKPSLKIVIAPDMLTISGKKVEEKQHEKDTSSSHVISARSMHIQQTLPAVVVPTENVAITHNADDKTLIIELPKKTQKQFAIKKK